MRQFDKIYASFNPKHLETLKPEAVALIGWTGWWQALWINEENEAYPGQWAMRPVDLEEERFPFAWTPEEDLELVKHA